MFLIEIFQVITDGRRLRDFLDVRCLSIRDKLTLSVSHCIVADIRAITGFNRRVSCFAPVFSFFPAKRDREAPVRSAGLRSMIICPILYRHEYR